MLPKARKWAWEVVADEWDRGGEARSYQSAVAAAERAATENGAALCDFEANDGGCGLQMYYTAIATDPTIVSNVFRIEER